MVGCLKLKRSMSSAYEFCRKGVGVEVGLLMKGKKIKEERRNPAS